MAHLGDDNGGLFGAPIDDSNGTEQSRIDADLVILPGGLMLVEQSSPLAKLPFFRCDSGEIECKNGRN